MGLCDPKAIRSGKAWYQAVNEPGFMGVRAPSELQPLVIGRIRAPSLAAQAELDRQSAREPEWNDSTSNAGRSQ